MVKAMTEGESNEQGQRSKRQRTRSLAIAWALGILAVLFYAATIVRLGPNAMNRDDFGRQVQPSSEQPAPEAGVSAPECKKAGTC